MIRTPAKTRPPPMIVSSMIVQVKELEKGSRMKNEVVKDRQNDPDQPAVLRSVASDCSAWLGIKRWISIKIGSRLFEYGFTYRVNTANRLLKNGFVLIEATGINKYVLSDGTKVPFNDDRNWNFLFWNRRRFSHWFTNKIMKGFFKSPIGIRSRAFNPDCD